MCDTVRALTCTCVGHWCRVVNTMRNPAVIISRLARALKTRCMYGVSGRKITKHTVYTYSYSTDYSRLIFSVSKALNTNHVHLQFQMYSCQLTSGTKTQHVNYHVV